MQLLGNTVEIEMKKILIYPVRLCYCVYAFLLFLALMMFVFPVAMIASFWGKMKGGDVIYKVCYYWALGWMSGVGIWARDEFDSPISRENQYIFVANHISYLDIPMIFLSLKNKKIRILGKIEMKRVPIFGFIYKNAVVMVDRSNHNTRAKSVRQLKSVLSKGISIFIFPEGTFNETGKPLKDFYDGAFRIAVETGTPIKPILFLDTYARMHYSSLLTLNPGKSRAIFLEEIQVKDCGMEDIQLIKEKVYKGMADMLTQYRAGWLRT